MKESSPATPCSLAEALQELIDAPIQQGRSTAYAHGVYDARFGGDRNYTGRDREEYLRGTRDGAVREALIRLKDRFPSFTPSASTATSGETPRTDAAVIRTVEVSRSYGEADMVVELVDATVARQLERELAAAVMVANRERDCWEASERRAIAAERAQSATASLGVLLESAIAHALEKRPENISDFCDDLRAFMNRAERGSDK